MVNPDPTSLDRLRDIVAPLPAPWWPPAPAWYWLLGFFLVVGVMTLLLALSRWQHNRYRREALAELALLEPGFGRMETRAAALRGLAELLKRSALTTLPREQVAGLVGPAWIEFLDRTGRTKGFSSGNGAILEKAVYDARMAAALDEMKIRELVSIVHCWLSHHDIQAASEENE